MSRSSAIAGTDMDVSVDPSKQPIAQEKNAAGESDRDGEYEFSRSAQSYFLYYLYLVPTSCFRREEKLESLLPINAEFETALAGLNRRSRECVALHLYTIRLRDKIFGAADRSSTLR